MTGSVQINLASSPFRRNRPYLVLTLASSVVLAVLLATQLSYTWVRSAQAASARIALQQATKQLDQLTREQAQLEAILRRPENSEAFQYSLFLNDLLRRKGISWTRLFSDIEEVMPHNVRLVDVRPQIDLNNRVQLAMTVAAQSQVYVIDFVKRLEASRLFGSWAVNSFVPPSQSDPLFRYRITCNYAPQL